MTTAILPLLSAAGKPPATFSFTGASLEGSRRFWFKRLGPALAERPDAVRALLSEPLAGEASIHELSEGVQRLPEAERDAFSAGLEALAGPDPSDHGLRAEHVRALSEAGCEIGFHTLRHHGLPSLGDGSLERELREGRDRLAEAAGHDAAVVAYPHGLVDDRVAAAARVAGFAGGFTTVPEAVRPDSDPLLLLRLGALAVLDGALRAAARPPSNSPPGRPSTPRLRCGHARLSPQLLDGTGELESLDEVAAPEELAAKWARLAEETQMLRHVGMALALAAPLRRRTAASGAPLRAGRPTASWSRSCRSTCG